MRLWQVTKMRDKTDMLISGEPDFSGKTSEPAVIITKHIALEAASALARENENELLSRFHPDMVRSAKLFEKEMSVEREIEILFLENIPALMLPLGEGGLLAALWHISKKLKMGMEIDMLTVPVRQETIEICEYYSLNPYELPSSGSLLIVTMQERRACRALKNAGINAAAVGSLNHGNDRLLLHGGVRSFLNKPSVINMQESLKCR